MSTLPTRLARCLVVLALLLAAAACGAGPAHRRVTIMVPWSHGEFQAFYSVVKRFEKQTGIPVDVQVTRALTQQLDAATAAGAPPDLAVLPSVGAIDRYVKDKKKGGLQPLDIDLGAYAQPFRGLATVKGKVYAVPVKADVKSLIWHPANSTGRSGKWCLGLVSGPTSGWPGADWIADIVLAEQGPDGYRTWITESKAQWTKAPVKDAWTEWRGMLGSTTEKAPATSFEKATEGMTRKAPTCSRAHGALSAMNFPFERVKAGDFAFDSTPGRPLQVSADFLGMFAAHNPDATKLIEYLSGTDAQRAWVRSKLAYAISADSKVTPQMYRTTVQQKIAGMLQPHSGHMLCFTAADVMQPDVSAAFYRAVLDYVTKPEALDGLLGSLDRIQKDRGSSPVASGELCANP
jgi:alpha-glucoside transport system substrate-binding protein